MKDYIYMHFHRKVVYCTPLSLVLKDELEVF